MPQTLGEAAKAVGKNRTTLLRAVKAGKLSATYDEAAGSWLIEPAELFRVYPPIDAGASSAQGGASTRSGPALGDVRELRARLEATEAAQWLRIASEVIDDLRRRLDASEEGRRRLTLMLADQRSIALAAPRRSWWPWRQAP
jgi:hypothetical protein